MGFQRPDLESVEPAVRAYIEALEAEIGRLKLGGSRRSQPARSSEPEDDLEAVETVAEPSEPPTTIQIITATASGVAKRTPRHLYLRQRRGGMGVFDLDAPNDEPPGILAMAEESQSILLLTNAARAFRLPVAMFPEDGVRATGGAITNRLDLLEGEILVAMLPIQAQGYVAMLSERGIVRMLRHHVFGDHMKQGTAMYDLKSFGALVSACWTPGDGELFIATRQGKGIRFSEKLVPPTGGPGIRLSASDAPVAITPIYEDSGVFLLGADGRGTVRLMSGFSPNKSPGAGGKIAITTDQLVSAAAVQEGDDIFVISRLSKIIRFPVSQVPAKDGVVQGVVCMSLRGDEPVSMVVGAKRDRLGI